MTLVTNSIVFGTPDGAIEVLRLSKTGIWANPDIPADEAAKLVLSAIETNILAMVQKAVADEREACAAICDHFQARDVGMQPAECAAAIRGQHRTTRC